MHEKEALVVYIPVLHSGYTKFIEDHPSISIYLIPGQMSELKFFSKDIRAISLEQMTEVLRAIFPNRFVGILTADVIESMNSENWIVVMPDEEISHEARSKYLSGCRVVFEDVFLRWHKRKIEEKEEVRPDFTIPAEGFLQNVLQIGLREASRSPDWWLQVGAVIWKDKKIILKGFNTHLPSPRIVESFGDPRAFATRGKNIELTTALHAEASLIATAAKFGIPLHGKSIFATVFPCPPCAKLIAESGIKWLYYLDGYSVLDGEAVLRQAEVRIIKISRE